MGKSSSHPHDAIRHRLGLILISSELPEVLAVSDRILVMHEGRLVAQLGAAEASEERIEGAEREPIQRARE